MHGSSNSNYSSNWARPLLFAVYVSPVENVIESFSVRHQQYADDAQLSCPCEPATWHKNSTCWGHVEQLAVERRQVTGHCTGHGQPAAFSDLDQRRRRGWCGAASRYNTEVARTARCHSRSSTDNEHAATVVKSCNYHARAIRHVRHLLTESVAQTLACSLINSRLDYCNSVVYSAPEATDDKLQQEAQLVLG